MGVMMHRRRAARAKAAEPQKAVSQPAEQPKEKPKGKGKGKK